MPPEPQSLVAPLSPLAAVLAQAGLDVLCLALPLLVLWWMLTPGDPKASVPTKAARRIRLLAALVALLPLLVLLGFLNLVGQRLIHIAATDPEEVLAGITAALTQKTGEPFSLLSHQGRRVAPVSDGLRQRLLPLPEADHCPLAFFGGSSVVEPDYDRAFPALTAQTLARIRNRPVEAINLGVPGYDSFSVRNRVQGFLAEYQPEVVLVYSGHNDYSFAFQRLLMPHYGILQGSPFLERLVRGAYRLSKTGRQNRERYPDGLDWLLLRQRVIEPSLLNLAGRLGLATIPDELIQAVGAQALALYKRNMHTILYACQKAGVPLVLLVPAGNLEHPPACAGSHCLHPYREGLSSPKGPKRLALLRTARDMDWANQDIRAKTPMLDWLRGWEQEGLWVLDLESALENTGVDFGWQEFIDLVHFSPETHVQVAEIIATFLIEQGVCAPVESDGEEDETAPTAPDKP